MSSVLQGKENGIDDDRGRAASWTSERFFRGRTNANKNQLLPNQEETETTKFDLMTKLIYVHQSHCV